MTIPARPEGRITLDFRRQGKRTSGAPYRKHLLDLDGLGVRDLAFAHDGLLILAGPTMDLDGPVRLNRWPGASPGAGMADVVGHDALDLVFDVPFGEGVDHAEGMAVLDGGNGGRRLLVVYDSPAPSRLHAGGTAIDADVFVLRP
jgi:hypothetical protein